MSRGGDKDLFKIKKLLSVHEILKLLQSEDSVLIFTSNRHVGPRILLVVKIPNCLFIVVRCIIGQNYIILM